MKAKIFIILYFSLFIFLSTLYSNITRGTEIGEIYISCSWYLSDVEHYAILHSIDNGETITLQYSSTFPPQPDTMQVGRLVSDATPGALYNYASYELWRSFNYGENWEFIEISPGKFTSGCMEGEIYKNCANYEGTIWRSIYYGNNFEEIRDSIKFKLEVGVCPGELYGICGTPGDHFNLYYSSDYGVTFSDTTIDTSVALYAPGGYYPELHHGTEQGEIYLVSWYPPSSYHIYHSTDYGNNFELKYISEYISMYYWGVSYTAGREPGSFYVIRTCIDATNTHLYIYYSNDYGENFTEYYHYLTENSFPVDNEIYHSEKIVLFQNYPNPFNPITIIHYHFLSNIQSAEMEIFNLKGEIIKTFKCLNQVPIIWDGTDKYQKKVSSGIYFYKLSIDNNKSIIRKLILIR